MTFPSLDEAVGRLTECAGGHENAARVMATKLDETDTWVVLHKTRAADLRTLLAALVEMRGALEPFAVFTDFISPNTPNNHVMYDIGNNLLGPDAELTAADFRAAAQALQQKEA